MGRAQGAALTPPRKAFGRNYDGCVNTRHHFSLFNYFFLKKQRQYTYHTKVYETDMKIISPALHPKTFHWYQLGIFHSWHLLSIYTCSLPTNFSFSSLLNPHCRHFSKLRVTTLEYSFHDCWVFPSIWGPNWWALSHLCKHPCERTCLRSCWVTDAKL